jgi:Aspartyl protease
MPLFSILLSFALFFQFRPAPPRLVEIPLLDCSGLPCVDLSTGSGKTLRLLLDLGETNAYLDIKTAQALGLNLESLKSAAGADIDQVQQTTVPGARLGDLPLGDFPFMVLDTTPQPDKLGQKTQPLPGDGALTYGAFANRLVEIDGPHHVLRVSEPQTDPAPCPQQPCHDLTIQHMGRWGPVTITTTGFTIDTQPVSVQLDTLFTGTVLVYPEAVEKLGLKKESKAKPKEMFPYTQGGLKLARADSGAVTFSSIPLLPDGPLYFAAKDAALPAVQFDATVGLATLNRAVAVFDFKGMHFWMEAPASGPPQ